jgi:hypothetical protein
MNWRIGLHEPNSDCGEMHHIDSTFQEREKGKDRESDNRGPLNSSSLL